MKSLKFARLTALAVLVAGASSAFAADSTTLAVSATVTGTCKLYTSAGGGALGAGTLTMGFGGIDPTSAGPATATTDVFFKCTKGSTPAFTVGGSATSPYGGTLTGSGTATGNSMTYSIAWTAPGAGSGAGFGVNAQSVTLNGSILAAQFSIAAAGPYAETVTISLAP